jgi:hypothetical protein
MVHQGVRAWRLVGPLLSGGEALFALLAGRPVPAQAQAGTVSGTVLDSKTGRPLPDATIVVEGTQSGARTGTRGDFRIANLTGTSIRLRATRVGYQPATVEATVGGPAVRIALVELVVKLDEIIVTGTAGEAQKRTLGNAVGRVDVSNTIQIAPPAKLQDMLSVNVPGVRVFRASGEVGSGGPTRIPRGRQPEPLERAADLRGRRPGEQSGGRRE